MILDAFSQAVLDSWWSGLTDRQREALLVRYSGDPAQAFAAFIKQNGGKDFRHFFSLWKKAVE